MSEYRIKVAPNTIAYADAEYHKLVVEFAIPGAPTDTIDVKILEDSIHLTAPARDIGIGLRDGKAKQALASVNKHLATKHGIVLQQPAYSKYYVHLGEISSYPPGYKENAGIFCHNNPWIIVAETMVGNGNRAFDYYTRINPSARENIGEMHRCEPYVFAQMIAGKDAPTHGEAMNSWLTGTAAWTYYTATQWILGIRAEHGGLRVDPVIPAKWKVFAVTRRFRGNTYVIEVRNPKGKQRGVRRIKKCSNLSYSITLIRSFYKLCTAKKGACSARGLFRKRFFGGAASNRDPFHINRVRCTRLGLSVFSIRRR